MPGLPEYSSVIVSRLRATEEDRFYACFAEGIPNEKADAYMKPLFEF